jgi:hypothetical protein
MATPRINTNTCRAPISMNSSTRLITLLSRKSRSSFSVFTAPADSPASPTMEDATRSHGITDTTSSVSQGLFAYASAMVDPFIFTCPWMSRTPVMKLTIMSMTKTTSML